MYQEKIKNYKQSNKNEFDLGFNSERLAYIPGYFSSYLDKSRLPNFTLLVSRDNQIAHLSKDISKKMSMELPFINIAAIEQYK